MRMTVVVVIHKTVLTGVKSKVLFKLYMYLKLTIDNNKNA